MKVAWSGRIGSRDGDVMGLCDGARDFRPCIAYMMAAMWRMAHTMRRNRLLALANESARRLRVLEKLL